MKFYIRAAKTLQQLKEQDAPDLEDSEFQEVVELDPSANFEAGKGGKYCPWLFRQIKKGNLTKEQYTNVKDALGYFLQNYKIYPKNDLNQYKTVDEFLTDTEAVGNRELTEKEKAKLLKKQAHHASDVDKKFLVEDGPWEVWTPLTYPGSVSLARVGGTKATWCTAYEGDPYYYNSYTRKGPLYVFINTSDYNEKYQLHFESNSWYDIHDDSQGMDAFYKFCEEHPAISKFFELKTENGIQYRASTVLGFADDATEIIVPDEMTALPEAKFPQSVEKIVLPDSLTKLRNEIFYNCINLKSVKLPNTITSIPRRAFWNCTSLESIEIPDSVVTYSEYAFASCENLKHIKHSSNLKNVLEGCFEDCASLEEQLPDSVTRIGVKIFNGAGVGEDGKAIKIPGGVTKIPKHAFQGTFFTNFDLNNATVIGAGAFSGSKLETIDLRSAVQIGSNAFRNCKFLKSIDINPNGAHLGNYSFADNDYAGTVTIYPKTTLGESVFDDCPNITIKWEKDDEPYEFYNIGTLICDEKKCPQLIKKNKGYVKIKTTEGKEYEVE
jgi:hypothetical protein